MACESITKPLKLGEDDGKKINIKLLLGITEDQLVQLPISALRKLLKEKCSMNPVLDSTALHENLSSTRKQAKKARRLQVETELSQFDELCMNLSLQADWNTKLELLKERDMLRNEILFYQTELLQKQ